MQPNSFIINNNIPILYSFRRCPFAIRARAAIFLSGVKVEIREVLLNNKPKEMIELSPKSTVPVLKLEDNVIDESFDIMLWALDKNDDNNLLVPYITNKELVINLLKRFDIDFKFHLDKYKYSSRYLDDQAYLGKEKHRYLAELHLSYLQSHFLENSLYLNGSKISILDLALFPLIRQFRLADINYFENNRNIKKTREWLEVLTTSSLFNDIMHKYSVWQKGQKTQYFFNPKYN